MRGPVVPVSTARSQVSGSVAGIGGPMGALALGERWAAFVVLCPPG